MKQMILLLVVSFLLASCDTSKSNYTITGKIEEGVELGDTLYLVTMQGQKPTVLSKSPVEHGAFEFEGFRSEPQFCSILSFAADGNIARNIDLFVEEGEINVTVTRKQTIVTGSNLNERLQQFRDSVDIIDELRNIYIEKKRRPDISPAAQREADKAIHTTSLLYNRYVKEFIEKNISNPVSVYILVNNYSALLPEAGLDIISRMPAEVQCDPSVSAVAAIYRNMMYSAVGNRFIDVELLNIEGKAVSLSQYAGKGTPLLLSFWSSSVASSLGDQKQLSALAAEYDNRLSLVSVSIDSSHQKWSDTVLHNELSGIQLADLKGWNSAAVILYGVDLLPYYILLDSNGTILMRTPSLQAVNEKMQLLNLKTYK